jgi:hypothetical protein
MFATILFVNVVYIYYIVYNRSSIVLYWYYMCTRLIYVCRLVYSTNIIDITTKAMGPGGICMYLWPVLVGVRHLNLVYYGRFLH